MDANSRQEWIAIGKISGVFGVHGWLRVFSYTEPRQEILNYKPWYVQLHNEWIEYTVVEGKRHGKGIVVHLQNCDDRDKAFELIDCTIAVKRSQLSHLPNGEYYWVDLIGLEVVNLQNETLGLLQKLFETGANDVMVVVGEREYLIPYVMGDVIHEVDLKNKIMRVDWGKDFDI